MERLTVEQQSLAEESLGRAGAIARRYARIFPEHEHDIESSANYGAVRAAATYIPELGGVWERWSKLCIKGSVQNFLGRAQTRKVRFWTQDVLEAVPGAVHDETSPEDADAGFDRLMALLPAKHKSLCRMVYKGGLTPRQAAEALGYSANHGDKLHREAISILREHVAA